MSTRQHQNQPHSDDVDMSSPDLRVHIPDSHKTRFHREKYGYTVCSRLPTPTPVPMALDTRLSLHKHPPPPSLRQPFLQLITVVTATIIVVSLLRSNRNPRLYNRSPAHARPADSCHIFGTNPQKPDLWEFSTRSLCSMSSLCFNTSAPAAAVYHYSNLSATRCHIDTNDFRPTSQDLPSLVWGEWRDCDRVQHDLILCAHGSGLKDDRPVCPAVLPLWPTMEPNWMEDITVLVPDFPYTYNIYHYASLVTDLVKTVENLDTLLERWGVQNVRTEHGMRYFDGNMVKLRKVNVVLQSDAGITRRHRWKQELLDLSVRERLEKGMGLNVNVTFMNELKGLVCMRNAVVLGRRGSVNLWPFANDTLVPLDGLSVPKDAIDFKRSIYNGVGLRERLPAKDGGVSEPPPFVVGYARRKFTPGDDGFFRSGSVRRFSEEDEAWFDSLLQNETQRVGAKLKVVEFTSQQSLSEQVKEVIQAGFIVGIHGANLVNSIFMRPFGVLMEILPQYLGARCYIAGANSGLKYLRFVAGATASPEESGCDIEDYECKTEVRQRMIKFGPGDKEIVRSMVKEGIEHLRILRDRFPRGVTTEFDRERVFYDVK